MVLITAKERNGEIIAQRSVTMHKALNLVRKSILMAQSMDETSADLLAINFMNKVNNNIPQAIENIKNGRTLTYQLQN